MKYLFYVSILIFSVSFITKEYRITKGFISQKIIHVFSILFIFLTNITAFRNLFAVIKNYKTFSDWNIYAIIEYLPFEIGLFISFISSLLSVMLYVIAFGMLARGDFSRKLLVWIIPIKTVLSFPIIHHIYRNHYNSLEQIISFWFVICMIIIYIGLFILYRSEFMKSFFNAKKQVINKTVED